MTIVAIVIALACFILACFPQVPQRINFVALGLAIYMVAILLGAPWGAVFR